MDETKVADPVVPSNTDLPQGSSDGAHMGLKEEGLKEEGVSNPENLKPRDPNSREFLGPLFGQVAVATVRNVLFNGVAALQNADKMLADKVAELREKKAVPK